MNIAIIDYGMGNLHSVCKALDHAAPNARAYLAKTAADIARADRILLPGQGAIKGCMANIRAQDIEEALRQAARQKPFLGICIGPQLMMSRSEENGGVDGLGFFSGTVTRFADSLTIPSPSDHTGTQKIKIPHMGWNTIRQTRAHPLWANIADNSHFYYVHSYHLPATAHTIGETGYGITFPAAIARGNLAGLQAHPEKSGAAGLQFLANFVQWQP
ncbi:MAG: imidazole glycerol phosphate synthase subunit HisH [Cardiobacteriaceae bacterium]|nr:imidazole glycerol phosphate synthase subunit HisH [Cardiobacteriaceae bacterium]